MQQMTLAPAFVGIGAKVVANGTQGLAAGAAATVTGLPRAGADAISAQPSAAFVTEGLQMLGLSAAAQEELAREGVEFAEIADIYAAADGSAGGLGVTTHCKK